MLNEDFESELQKVRQALTNSIAVEKQIEMQVEKNKQSIDSWQKRAQMARDTVQEEMAKQAEERSTNLQKRNNELEIEHLVQKDFSANLKKDLAKLEARRYTAFDTGRGALAESDASLSNVDRMEEKIQHRIHESEAMVELTDKTDELEKSFEADKKKEAIEDELEALKAKVRDD